MLLLVVLGLLAAVALVAYRLGFRHGRAAQSPVSLPLPPVFAEQAIEAVTGAVNVPTPSTEYGPPASPESGGPAFHVLLTHLNGESVCVGRTDDAMEAKRLFESVAHQGRVDLWDAGLGHSRAHKVNT